MRLNLDKIIRYGQGKEAADLLLKNGKVVNVFTGEILQTDIAMAGGTIVGLGEGYDAMNTIDLSGKYVCPGFIDGHLHIESTMLSPYQFARAVVPRGTTAVVCDPHEIANVLGMDGIQYMLEASEALPLTVFVMAPSCVPATHLETSGAVLSAQDLAPLFDHPRVLGLAEMMNFPGVLYRVPEVLAKLEIAGQRGLIIDGHAPGLTGHDLQAYIAAGIDSDHECTKAEEALEKLRAGMYLFIREGSTEKNLATLLPVVTKDNARRCLLVSDDRHPADLMDLGHMDYSVRLAVERGLNPITAIQMVTLNAAERFRLYDRGAVAPGYRADLVVIDDLRDFSVDKVFVEGDLVAEDGRALFAGPPKVSLLPSSVNISPGDLDLEIPVQGKQVRVIGVVEGQILTDSLKASVSSDAGLVMSDVERDILKLAVIERHHATGNIGLGLVKGIGLKKGALASTVAHDSHNLIVVGTDDRDMLLAAQALIEIGGGLAAAADGEILKELPLPIAGLMSEAPFESVRTDMDDLLAAAHRLGSPLKNPFMTLSFLALPVIPALRLTDMGLVDVDRFDFVPLFL
ncbi:MAG: adenine deaminase [Nitrospiraceae bacterium]|nr:adenine deaminase [Nitrospiraceae bacterium]